MQELSSWDSYHNLALVYDKLMEDAPYDSWLDYAEKIWNSGVRPETVVDLGCGTGTLAAMLAAKGYRVTGIDLSPEMLAVAEQKTRGLPVTLLCQDMSSFSLPFEADAVISFCDSLNYLLREEEVQRTFFAVYQHLREGGVFLFDVHTPYKVTEVFGSSQFALAGEDVSYIWNCHLDEDAWLVEHELTFFIREGEGGLYRREEEWHHQRAYPLDRLKDWLLQAGFGKVEVTGGFASEPLTEDCERAFIVAYRDSKPL